MQHVAAEPLPLIEELRASTRDDHAALDASLAVTAEMTKERYVAFLRASHSVVAPLEGRIGRWIVPFGPIRSLAIAADLTALGAGSVPKDAPVPVLDTIARGYGAAYVVEGSSLGGVHLARTLEGTFPDALRYLRLRDRETGSHWRSFLARLAEVGAMASKKDRGDACAAAHETFAAYGDAFAKARAVG